ncbi:CIC family chloride channel protein [Desulfohalotomaculum tongense]|uniref:chloride channel protein n=1 Tax=Desulforadius tongensis TaxID=1216062 RepID=UPI001959114A|nr:chloride channel protein [Desulforadius tongensis]MBM7854410.1 CIC family chloride channel protein [Desulforadius tongensis]
MFPVSASKKVQQAWKLALGLIVGALCGLAVYGFIWLLDFFTSVFFDYGKNIFGFTADYYVVILPALGGLIVGPLVYFLAKEARGHGVPEVMEDVALNGGTIPVRVVAVKSLAAAVCIGSGGSAGRVGPIIHIGSGIGSAVGQLLKTSPHVMRDLVACGAAGGVAATFNAPIGGVMFALEVILGEFAATHLMMVIISSVTASVVSRALLGDSPFITMPQFTMHTPVELLLYGFLGVAAGVFSFLYIKTFYRIEDLFKSLDKIPVYFKPVIGGLLVGSIGLFFPQVFGVGYNHIEDALAGNMTLGLMVSLLLLKLLATSITLGSGGSGGVFAPSLYLGAMLGGIFGIMFNHFFPNVAVYPMAYALAGMAGVLAGSSFAPITGIILLFEMSNDYRLILPLMITCVISYVISNTFSGYSIYTTKLLRKGLDLEELRRPDVLKDVLVCDVMNTNPESLLAIHTAMRALKEVNYSQHQGFPVLDLDGTVMGVITRKELRWAALEGQEKTPIHRLLKRELVCVRECEPLSRAVSLMSRHGVGRLPVVDENKRLLGIISRSDVIKAYGKMNRPETYDDEQFNKLDQLGM